MELGRLKAQPAGQAGLIEPRRLPGFRPSSLFKSEVCYTNQNESNISGIDQLFQNGPTFSEQFLLGVKRRRMEKWSRGRILPRHSRNLARASFRNVQRAPRCRSLKELSFDNPLPRRAVLDEYIESCFNPAKLQVVIDRPLCRPASLLAAEHFEYLPTRFLQVHLLDRLFTHISLCQASDGVDCIVDASILGSSDYAIFGWIGC